MAKLREVIAGAVLEVEGSPEACAATVDRFHQMLYEREIAACDERLKAITRERGDILKRRRMLRQALEHAQRCAVYGQASASAPTDAAVGQS